MQSESESVKTRQDELMTVLEVAALLRVKPQWVYSKLHSHSLPFPHIKLDRRNLRFPRADVERFLGESRA